MQGAVDTEIEIDGHALTPTKQRDIETGDAIGFKLVPMVVGVDEDDEPISSCVVQQAPVATATPDGTVLKGNSKSGWDVLCTVSPNNAPVEVEAWKEACREFLGSRNIAQRFYDLKSRLEKMGLIEVSGSAVTRRME